MYYTQKTLALLLAALFALSVPGTWASEAEAQSRPTKVKTKKKARKKKKRKRKRRARGPKRTGGYFRWGVGVGGCMEDPRYCTSDPGTNFQFGDLSIGHRENIFAFEANLQVHPTTLKPANLNEQNATWGGLLAGLKLFPSSSGRVDPYVGLRLGFGGLSYDNPPARASDPPAGFMAQLLGGVDFFVSKQVALGGLVEGSRIYGPEDETIDFWGARINLVIYFDWEASSSTRTRKKKKKRRKRKAPKRPRL